MKEKQLYICCKANDPRCPGCKHAFPHERWSIEQFLSKYKEVCTNYTTCFDRNGEELPFKVRCIKVKNNVTE